MRRRHCNKPQSVTKSVFGYITQVCPVLFTGMVHFPTNRVQSSNCAATTQPLYSKGGQTLESQGLKVFFTFSIHFCPRDTVKNDLFVVVVVVVLEQLVKIKETALRLITVNLFHKESYVKEEKQKTQAGV